MGFELINCNSKEELTDLQQNINLSFNTFKSIKNDLIEFSPNNNELPFSGFLNTIIENFIFDAETSINTKTENYETELYDKLGTQKETAKIISFLCKEYKNKLIEKFNERIKRKKFNDLNYPSKFRINSNNIKKLNSINEPFASDGSISLGNFLKGLFEEYSDFPKYKREQIYFHNTFNLINSALNQKKSIKLFLNNNFDEKGVVLLCKPYKILHDELYSKNYLVCVSQILNEKTKKWENKKISSIRISRISSINIQTSIPAFISNDLKLEIDNLINKKGVEFLLSKLVKLKIKFDDEGLRMLKNILYLKPNNYKKIDKYTYLFICTEYQANLYFPKFENHLKILNSTTIDDSK